MNNIDILEDYIELIEKGYCEDCNELCNISTAPSYPSKAVAQAISTLIAENKELKEKNKWKPIKEYNRQKYDWVLVKYFDGNYECVPEVAEQRNDGKWYTSEKQIPFEVKYFFDMQSLLERSRDGR